MKPLIGINLDIRPGTSEQFVLNATYSRAVQAAGGIPILISPMPDEDLIELLSVVSGIIFTGGKDYNPDLYGNLPHEKIDLAHPLRQDFDIRLMRMCLLNTQLPILGICAGHQLLNIALGGTLVQHLDDGVDSHTSIKHVVGDEQASDFSRHQIKFDRSSHLKKIFGFEKIDVPSSHHQAVGDLGAGLRVSSKAEDGIIESIELPHRGFTVGVQWHPERDYAGNSPLFNSFLGAAAGY
jgi:putative glutamine amidotransferase